MLEPGSHLLHANEHVFAADTKDVLRIIEKVHASVRFIITFILVNFIDLYKVVPLRILRLRMARLFKLGHCAQSKNFPLIFLYILF